MQEVYNTLAAFAALTVVPVGIYATYIARENGRLRSRMSRVEMDIARNECRIDCLGNDVANHDTQLDIQQAATNTINGRIAALESPRLSVWTRIKGRLRYGR